MAGTLDEAVEIVGEDRRLALGHRHAEGTAQEVGDEGGIVGLLRQYAIVGREKYDAVEVEAARFEHTHHLQSHDGLSAEGNGGRSHHLPNEAAERDEGEIALQPCHMLHQHLREAFQKPEHLIVRLALQHIFEALL